MTMSQVDPAVLAELPPEMQAELMALLHPSHANASFRADTGSRREASRASSYSDRAPSQDRSTFGPSGISGVSGISCVPEISSRRSPEGVSGSEGGVGGVSEGVSDNPDVAKARDSPPPDGGDRWSAKFRSAVKGLPVREVWPVVLGFLDGVRGVLAEGVEEGERQLGVLGGLIRGWIGDVVSRDLEGAQILMHYLLKLGEEEVGLEEFSEGLVADLQSAVQAQFGAKLKVLQFFNE